ncbi:MAG: response regulator [Gammaproteobacteria bacterium]
MQPDIRVLIVDDHELVRAGIVRNLASTTYLKVVGEASSGAEAIQLAAELKPDVILLDYKMPDMNGMQASKELLKHDPQLKILIVSVLVDELLLPKLFKIGIAGFYSKNSDHEEMLKAINQVAAGHRYISRIFTQQLMQKNIDHETFVFDSLSEREFQVILMLLDGHTIAEVSERLDIDRKTINSYRSRAFHKLNVKNDVELTLLAMRQSLIS